MQGIASFPGVKQTRGFNFTLSHGITPSVCYLSMAPQRDFVAEGGTLTLRWGDAAWEFPGCKVDNMLFQKSTSSLEWSLPILDRRWRWKFGHISGRYNLIDEQSRIDPNTEKTPRELLKLCLEEMGEEGYDVDNVPDESRPEVEWEYIPPAVAMADLADRLGCRIVLGCDNRVRIWPLGMGDKLPDSPQLQADSLTIDTPERPDSILLVGAASRWQLKWKLRAVGLDTDGKIKPIDELSYKPEGGWGVAGGFTFLDVATGDSEEAEKKRALARQTVYRWYQIYELANSAAGPTVTTTSGTATATANGLTIPGIKDPDGKLLPLDDINAVLPLSDVLLETAEEHQDETARGKKDPEKKPKPGEVAGVFNTLWGRGNNTAEGTRFEGEWSLDHENGIVQFPNPVYKIDDNDDPLPADLTLICTHGIRNKQTRTWLRYEKEYEFDGPKFGTQPEVIRAEDVQRRYIGDRTTIATATQTAEQPKDNDAELEDLAEPYLQAASLKYENQFSQDRVYTGLHPFSPDGAIQQVSWSASVTQGATTRASRGTEHADTVPSHQERRQLEQLKLSKLALQAQQETEAAQKRVERRKGLR